MFTEGVDWAVQPTGKEQESRRCHVCKTRGVVEAMSRSSAQSMLRSQFWKKICDVVFVVVVDVVVVHG